MAQTQPDVFRGVLEALLGFLAIAHPDPVSATESNFSMDWRLGSLLLPGPTTSFLQTKCWTERFTGPLLFNPVQDNRHRILRLKMDFWQPLDDEESESDALGKTGTAGEVNTQIERFGSPEYWRDTYPKFANATVDGMDMDTPPVFTVENIGGLMMHWTVSVALVAHNT